MDDVWQVCGVSPLVGTHWGWRMPLSFQIFQHIFFFLRSADWPCFGLRSQLKAHGDRLAVWLWNYIKHPPCAVSECTMALEWDILSYCKVIWNNILIMFCFHNSVRLQMKRNLGAWAGIVQKWACGPWKKWKEKNRAWIMRCVDGIHCERRHA